MTEVERATRLLDKFGGSEPEEHRGGTIRRAFLWDGSRYPLDAGLVPHGWRQYDTDQDAWYFGVWVHVAERLVITYAEGDLSFEQFPCVETFAAELARMGEFYGETPAHIKAIDTATGQITHYVDTRPEAKP